MSINTLVEPKTPSWAVFPPLERVGARVHLRVVRRWEGPGLHAYGVVIHFKYADELQPPEPRAVSAAPRLTRQDRVCRVGEGPVNLSGSGQAEVFVALPDELVPRFGDLLSREDRFHRVDGDARGVPHADTHLRDDVGQGPLPAVSAGSELGGLERIAGVRADAVGTGEVPGRDERLSSQALVEQVGDQAHLGSAGGSGDRDELTPRTVKQPQVLGSLLLPCIGEEAFLRHDRGHFLHSLAPFQVLDSGKEQFALATSARLKELFEHLVLSARVEELDELTQELAVTLGEEPVSGWAQSVDDFRAASTHSTQTGAVDQPEGLEGLEMIPDGLPGESGHRKLGDGRLAAALDFA